MTPSGFCSSRNCVGSGYREYGGLCAVCFLGLSEEQRFALRHPDEERPIVTYRIPAQPGFVKRVLSSAVGTVVGAAVAVAAARLLGWL